MYDSLCICGLHGLRQQRVCDYITITTILALLVVCIHAIFPTWHSEYSALCSVKLSDGCSLQSLAATYGYMRAWIPLPSRRYNLALEHVKYQAVAVQSPGTLAECQPLVNNNSLTSFGIKELLRQERAGTRL